MSWKRKRRGNHRRFNKLNIECYNYNKYKHYAWECCDTSKKKKEQQVNLLDDKQDEEETSLLLTHKDGE